jgi:two-component system response regulator AtoC
MTVYDLAQPAEDGGASSSDPRCSTVETILIVEDDGCLRASLATALGGEYQVRAVDGGTAAVNFLRENTVDLILLDMVMAEGDGLTVLSHVAGMSPRPRVVVLSVLDEVRKAVKAMRLGADYYLVKPCDLERLKTVLRHTMHPLPSSAA